jgi:hypothetical protein
VLDLRIRRGEREEFFALLESEEIPRFTDPTVWTGWIRYVSAGGDEGAMARLLDVLPVAFGPDMWFCPDCGAEDHEPRAACLACGAPIPLEPRGGEGVS